jgi:hypothetical protein
MGQRVGQRVGNRVTQPGRLAEPEPWRLSAYFRRQRRTRKCQRCGAWLAVDQPDPWLCSPCQVAKGRR